MAQRKECCGFEFAMMLVCLLLIFAQAKALGVRSNCRMRG
jgi:hypothetical protein